MKVQLKNANPASEIQLSDAAFGRAYNEALVHQVVTAYMAGGRAGTKRQKSRAEVRGGGKKPWSQKGTGQARAGSSRRALWVCGGRAVGALDPVSLIKHDKVIATVGALKLLEQRLGGANE